MKTINVLDCDNNKIPCPVYDLETLPIEQILEEAEIVKTRKRSVYNVPCAFDIETTSYRDDNPHCFMYHWQFCIRDCVIFGRTWEEFKDLMCRLRYYTNKNGIGLVIWVHNLSFEFSFMRYFIGEIESVFAREVKAPISVRTEGNIEFRCSYYLTNMSLSLFCRNAKGCRFWKRTDEYDYRKYRTPETPLTEEEEGYCYCDVRGLCEAICSKLQDGDNLLTLPLTSTGYVRRTFRDACIPQGIHELVFDTQLSVLQYNKCREAFRGGNTGANILYVGDIMKNVESYDLQSSYPAAMMYDKYPISKFVDLAPTEENFRLCIEMKRAFLVTLKFRELRVRTMAVHPYLDKAHCRNLSGGRYDNGRVMEAANCEVTLTDIDYDIINSHYYWQDMEVLYLSWSRYDYLPLCFRQTLAEMFYSKCILKFKIKDLEKNGLTHTEEYQNTIELYNKYKNQINGSYGMMVTDITHDIVEYAGEWRTMPVDTAEALEKYYKNKKSFLAYQWGVWVCANARKRLQDGIDAVGSACLYTDTDSIKCRSGYKQVFARLNEEIEQKARQAEVSNLAIFPEINGKVYKLGTWDYEGNYERFRTWGAKKYAYEENGELHITVAGLNKTTGAEYLKIRGGLEAFVPSGIDHKGFEVPSTWSGRTTAYYIDLPPHFAYVGDNYKILTAGGTAIFNTTYKLGITGEYMELMEEIDDLECADLL